MHSVNRNRKRRKIHVKARQPFQYYKRKHLSYEIIDTIEIVIETEYELVIYDDKENKEQQSEKKMK